MKRRFGIRTLLVATALIAILLASPPILRRAEFNHRLSEARAMTEEPDSYKTSAKCNRKLHCQNGDSFHLYFWSTNGNYSTSHSKYMISVITLPDGEQFVKEEPFRYKRSRVVADPPNELEDNLRWEGLQVPADGYDFWDIHQAKDHTELRALLTKHQFRVFD